MPSDDRLLLILRRLDEIERKLDHMLDELRTPTAIGYSARGAIVQGRIEACPTVVDANPLALDYKSDLSLDYGTKPSYKVR